MKSKYQFATLLCVSALTLGLSACSDNQAPNHQQSGENASGTLNKIKQSGTIVLGYRDSSIPFSYIADNPN